MSLWYRAACLLVVSAILSSGEAHLPVPTLRLPEDPPLPPTVITAGGQRLPLAATDATLRWDADLGQIVCNRPGWWIINYPWDAITGLSGKTRLEIQAQILGKRSAQVKNWYLRSPGAEPPDPSPPTGPSPIRPSTRADVIVDQQHPKADDANPGTAELPLKTIAAAMAKVQPGTVVQVRYGIYREAIAPKVPGTAAQCIIIEGARDAKGRMPVLDGNDPAPAAGWAPVRRAGVPDGVWRADHWTDGPGQLAIDGRRSTERTLVQELQPGEFCQNRGAIELAFPRLDGTADPQDGLAQFGSTWRKVVAGTSPALPGGTGWEVDLGERRGVYYLSTWLWVDPSPRRQGEPAWTPQSARSFELEFSIPGGCRTARTTGLRFDGQQNPTRYWVNGALYPAWPSPDTPAVATGYGTFGDGAHRARLQEGWNHLVFLVDTSVNTNVNYRNRIGFNERNQKKTWRDSATRPLDLGQGPADQQPDCFVRNWLVLGPLPTEQVPRDHGVYVRADPARQQIGMGARNCLANLDQPFWTVRGFEFRHGRQFQQSALVQASAEGCTIEYCLVREPEVRGITAALQWLDQSKDPITLRGNWILDPGSLGIGSNGNSGIDEPRLGLKQPLTADNQDTTAPGRGRVLIEQNVIANNNRNGYEWAWESGGIKVLKMTGAVIRHNTVIGGFGPGIWFDWENYSNRCEGNLLIEPHGFGVGVEASPGANLVANNIVIGNRPGGAWFASALMAWSSKDVWIVNNTCDGRWQPDPSGKPCGTSASLTHEGPNDRGTIWGAFPSRFRCLIDNLVLGYGSLGPVYGDENLLQANYADNASAAIPCWSGGLSTSSTSPVRNRLAGDYRPVAGPLLRSGAVTSYTAHAPHDFNGLLRFPDLPRSVGAHRAEQRPLSDNRSQIEIEYIDGTMQRLYQLAPAQLAEPAPWLADLAAVSVPAWSTTNPHLTSKVKHYLGLEGVGGRTASVAAVSGAWSVGHIEVDSNDFNDRKRLLPLNRWREDLAWNDKNQRFENKGWSVGSGQFGIGQSSRTFVAFTAGTSDTVVPFVHVHSMVVQGSGRVMLVLARSGADSGEVLWQSASILRRDDGTRTWDNRPFFAPVALAAGDRVAVIFECEGWGGAESDFRIGRLAPAAAP